MKIRDGFISNSSSSNFVVALDKIPKNKNDVKEMFYKGMDKSLNCCTEKVIDTDILSGVIWNDLKTQKPTKSIKKLSATISSGSVIDCLEPDSDDYVDRKTLKGWDKYQLARDEYAELMAKMFLNANKKRFIYILSFSDNAGEIQGHLEHGDTFNFVRHLTICCH